MGVEIGSRRKATLLPTNVSGTEMKIHNAMTERKVRKGKAPDESFAARKMFRMKAIEKMTPGKNRAVNSTLRVSLFP